MKMQRLNGFTLIELMIVIAIGSILAMVAIPSFSRLMQENSLSAATNDLVSTFNFARSEAVRRGSNVGVCATADQGTCSASADWSTGWLVWSGASNAGPANTTEILRVHEALGLNATLNKVDGSSTAPILYSSTGTKTPTSEAKLEMCDSNRTDLFMRTITISTTGRNQSEKATSVGC
ncbi:MAG: prepilin-type N-terminal cleavage/methylation domain-containing protein [Methylococcales bacterium]|jgi:type IV fimbrial biogenesis protein FimT|nr:prepilin-type N-terminal cleavage/methylation domain-containing protein [Methylococcales bacterium]MBT7444282.1 prepilin-type N-terminal cleavage/methylation domain-containing protein [Methylococcales bacterium]